MNAKQKNICVVRHGKYPNDPRVYKQVRALAEAGYAVDVICLRTSEKPSREVIDGVRVYRLLHVYRRGSIVRYALVYTLSILFMGTFLSLLSCRRRYRCIQVNTLPDALVFTTLLPRVFGARVLLDMHEPTPELLQAKYRGRSKPMLQTQILIEKLAIRYAHQVITVNDTIRARFIERGANPDKIDVVRNVPPEHFGQSASSRKRHEGLVIMTHGTLQPRYGHSILLQALPRIRQEFGQLKVIIAGLGETMDALKNLSTELGCDDLVTFTGLVSLDEIAELISQSDIGIVPLMPSPFSELCQPNKLFEYIDLKVAVAAVRLPAIEESFDDSCLAYFDAGDVDGLANCIIKLGKNSALRETLATNAYARYESLRWSVAKDRYVRMIDQLIETQTPRHERGQHEY